jgi:hypothetical protein
MLPFIYVNNKQNLKKKKPEKPSKSSTSKLVLVLFMHGCLIGVVWGGQRIRTP